jgi:hypothetical protein
MHHRSYEPEGEGPDEQRVEDIEEADTQALDDVRVGRAKRKVPNACRT